MINFLIPAVPFRCVATTLGFGHGIIPDGILALLNREKQVSLDQFRLEAFLGNVISEGSVSCTMILPNERLVSKTGVRFSLIPYEPWWIVTLRIERDYLTSF